MVAALDPKTWWYTARAAGVVAWAVLGLSVVWGLALSTKVFGRNPAPAWLLDLHRHLGGLALVFTGVHLTGLALDGYVHFGAQELFVPLASSWKPDAVAWGIAGFYLLVAVELTSLLQRRIPRRWWRRVHYASFPLYVTATIHLATAGSDRATAPVQWSAVVVSVVIVVLASIRAAQIRDKRTRDANPAPRSRRPSVATDP